jgi:hypothetical protein
MAQTMQRIATVSQHLVGESVHPRTIISPVKHDQLCKLCDILNYKYNYISEAHIINTINQA